MSRELEVWCQNELDKLLKQKAYLIDKNPNDAKTECELPHFQTFLTEFKKLEERQFFLFELNDRISDLERECEQKKFKDAFSSLRLAGSSDCCEITPIKYWLQEMMSYTHLQPEIDYTKNIKFFDIEHNETVAEELLSWTTLYQERPIRITVSCPVGCKEDEADQYSFSASFYVDGLVEDGKDFISSRKSPGDYIETVWSSLQKLLDSLP